MAGKWFIRTLGRTARTLAFLAVFGIAFAYSFTFIFTPVLIISGMLIAAAAISAFLYKDSMAVLMVNLAKHLIQDLTDTQPRPYDEDFSLDSFSNRAKFVLATPFFSLGVAAAVSSIASFVVAAWLGKKTITALDFITSPVTKLIGPDPELAEMPEESRSEQEISSEPSLESVTPSLDGQDVPVQQSSLYSFEIFRNNPVSRVIRGAIMTPSVNEETEILPLRNGLWFKLTN